MTPPTRFSDLPLSREVLDALAAMGFESPTDIQREAIPPLLAGKDVIGQAQTGTGKTAAFGIPVVERMGPKGRKPQALILVPTRELAEQVTGELHEIGQFKGIDAVPVYGGTGFGPQIKGFREGAQVVVGTPGRVMDHMRRGNVRFDEIKMFVLDEADRMLDMGFVDDIKWIMARIPRDCQHLLFSATLPNAILTLAQEIMRNPVNVAVSEDKLTVEGTEQIYYNVGYRNKVWALYRVLEAEKPDLAFVFCRTKMEADKVNRLLKSHGYPSEALHGDMSQKTRNEVMDDVRQGKVKIVVATDVLARGIDVSHCTHVINYDIPEDPEWYVHRIGRTGRMGRTGKAITFVTSEEGRARLDLEAVSGGTLRLEEVPETEGGGKDKIQKVIDWKEVSDPTGMVSFRVEVGAKDGVKMIDIFKAVNKKCGFREDTLGSIWIREDHAIVQVPWLEAKRFHAAYAKGELLGKKARAEIVATRRA
ncbi:MAG TPA: DEAD/DEAH box helicase [Candidatus Thermoplasmatota archaeon]|nr:DEAD/DEAH box helicase [Candidatus Thermoplasmatota archaeon]